MGLRMRRGQRRIFTADRFAARHRQRVVGIKGDDGHESDARLFRHAEPRAQPRAAIQFRCSAASEFGDRPVWHIRQREAGRVGEEGK